MLDMKKTLIIGNPSYGLAKSIGESIGNCDFVSRSVSGTDLALSQARTFVAEMSLEYDTVILVSALSQFRQTQLLESVINEWVKFDHSGYIICIGSSADTPVKASTWMYPVEKRALRAYCRQLSQITSSESPKKWKITYLAPGNLHTPRQDEKMPGVRKLDCSYVASIVKWLLEQPDYVNISELCLDRIQS